MSVENDPGFWKWVAGTVAGGLGGMFGYHKYMDSRISKKADKTYVDAAIGHVGDELARSRDVQAKLFDQQRENEQRAQDRFERLMDRITGSKP